MSIDLRNTGLEELGTKCAAQNAERLGYMEAIKRQIYVLRDVLKDEIVYSLGTDLVPIEYHIMDFTVPATATAVVYVLKPSGKLDKKLADVLDNTISFAPHIGFFEEGENQIQVRIVNREKALVSFTEMVRTKESMKFDDAAEAQQKTLIEQVLTKVGEYTGTVQIEIADRKAAVTKEETDRKSEDEAIREKMTSLETKNEEDVRRLESLITAKCSAIAMGGYNSEWELTEEWKQTGNYIESSGENEYHRSIQGSEGYIEIKQGGVYLIIMQSQIRKKTSESSGNIWSEIRVNEKGIGGDTHFMPVGSYYDTLSFSTYQYLPAGSKLKLYLGVNENLTGVWSTGQDYLNIIRLG